MSTCSLVFSGRKLHFCDEAFPFRLRFERGAIDLHSRFLTLTGYIDPHRLGPDPHVLIHAGQADLRGREGRPRGDRSRGGGKLLQRLLTRCYNNATRGNHTQT